MIVNLIYKVGFLEIKLESYFSNPTPYVAWIRNLSLIRIGNLMSSIVASVNLDQLGKQSLI